MQIFVQMIITALSKPRQIFSSKGYLLIAEMAVSRLPACSNGVDLCLAKWVPDDKKDHDKDDQGGHDTKYKIGISAPEIADSRRAWSS